MYWYCDIVDFDYNEETNELVVTDLLADVIVYPDGYVKVVDIDELVTALDDGLITLEQLKNSLTGLDSLLQSIYNDKFDLLTIYIDRAEQNGEALN
jgi:predicted RNA-binding protein associated with RNAse of E/G family